MVENNAETDGKVPVTAGTLSLKELLALQRVILLLFLLKVVSPFVDPFFYVVGCVVGAVMSVVNWARYMRHMFWHWMYGDL